jgi:hypothetical protein
MKYTRMPSPVNLIVGVLIRRHPSIFMNVAMWEHCSFDCEIFRCGKILYTNSIIITDFVLTFIPNFRSKNAFPAYFGIEIS